MPEHEPYARFKEDELILRDYLAADRTALANERTFLSYLRTGLAFGAAGVSLVHFLESVAADIAGVALVLLALVTLGLGARQFFWYKRRIERVRLK